jgi:hypothetical protein
MRTRDAAASHKVHGAPLDTTSTARVDANIFAARLSK